jgi:hypothetical protein
VGTAEDYPQVEGSALGSGSQVPMVPGSAQDEHGAAQAVAQQTPWAQCPLAHSASVEQAAGSDRPQLPLLQVEPSSHSADDTQSM